MNRIKTTPLIVAALLALQACGAPAESGLLVQRTSHSVGASAQRSGPSRHWIVSEFGIHHLLAAIAPSRVAALFDSRSTYEIMDDRNKPDPLPHAQHLLYYRDETLIAHDIQSGAFSGLDGALYDDENYNEPGNSTPLAQREHPIPYAQDAANVLHAAGLAFVYTIGWNTGPPGDFLTQTLPGVAPYPDVIDFQTQSAEGTPNFARLVSVASSAFRPFGNGLMLAGIGADPQGKTETEADIESAFDAGESNAPPVDGYWINLAVKSPSCTKCRQQVDIAAMVKFLASLP